MKNIVAGCILLACIGCKEITYREPQPKGVEKLQRIPKSLQGKYLLPEDNRSLRDTLVVKAHTYFASSDPKGGSTLSDSLMIKQYKGFYFISINDRPEWLLRVIEQEKNGDISCYMLQAEDNAFPDLLKQLSQVIKVDSTVLPGETLYQIDPSPKELLDLIKKGYFKKTATLKKIQ
ncbi:MAG TPA: hypothetical protein VIN08_12760 [Ohtaekwangia sp.]|uniref:hypothetical protein n=1 Tax=Ohtaekwangia sp. TaxID=2066019 RepID=UPI002F92E56B